jgi:hypothetical protein
MWLYWNPFWHVDRVMTSSLGHDECRNRLRGAKADDFPRIWLARGDATFYKAGLPRYGSMLEMHARVTVLSSESGPATLRLRFSGGSGSALLLALVDVACVGAFIGAVTSFVTAGWSPKVGAGLFAILIPVLLVLALRSEAPDDQDELWQFVASQVEGHEAPSR